MNGSKKMCYRASLCLLILICSTSSLLAEEQNNDALPTIEFLEFLGEWESDDGAWIDPSDLENEEIGKLIETTIETDNEN